jgi:hypothetical protein
MSRGEIAKVELNEKALEQILDEIFKLSADPKELIKMKPTRILVQPYLYKTVKFIVFPALRKHYRTLQKRGARPKGRWVK